MTRAKAVGHKLIVCCKANPDIHIINVTGTVPDVWRRPIAKILAFLALPGLSRFLSGVVSHDTMPPRDVVMATGAVGGANYELGIRYREILSQSGIKLQLLPTTGGLEKLARLRTGVDIGFIQGGTTAVDDAADVEFRLARYFTNRCGSSTEAKWGKASRRSVADGCRSVLKEVVRGHLRSPSYKGSSSIV